ncbi:rhamnulokinase [Candidatus Hakubella thermalkaliphila]|uniref:Rhamnulokinase n=2 Tax=Candidatus Hakubella thermalkaliphila TaxID=2754717 RepID=A0A6V8PFV7_9ACTN|nr:rhamnulokinase family protein [Candidatus Hakubella thermalkaliphila]GFP18685.1 rhamnulokinase [Candidatus Hakubella thermalkaliphila]GFP29766.1 rhamnulokinase [Candidatus Hakubella thermalkaliphila]GFP39195.1 rhamnulokinase [Candidatus Hakubella thermalkaliphila]
MAKTKNYLAFDFGASNGKAVLGRFDGKTIVTEEIHNFENIPVLVNGTLYWDILKLFHELKVGLGKAVKVSGGSLNGIGIDTWGVDFGLISQDGALISNPVHYRDKRATGMMEKVFSKVPPKDVFFMTGAQTLEINTLYHIYSMVLSKSPLLKIADLMLHMPDLFNYFLTGEKIGEFTIATTSQMYDQKNKVWARELLKRLDIPYEIMPEIVMPGTVIGNLLPEICQETGFPFIPVIAPACHDTGSAVAGVPVKSDSGKTWAFISSGTWSIMGVEVNEPILSQKAYEKGYANEGGVAGTYRFLKNITGLWIIQECRSAWEAKDGREISWEEICSLASQAPLMASFIDADNAIFARKATDMSENVIEFCKNTHQKIPLSREEISRAIFESLALKYRVSLEQLKECLGKKVELIHLVGGGSKNKILSQWTANATGLPVIAGPAETTANGNLMLQLIATGDLSSIKEAREVIIASSKLDHYEPKDVDLWNEAYERYKNLVV